MRRVLAMLAAILSVAATLLGTGGALAGPALAAAPATAPTVIGPLDGDTVGTNPLFAWSAVAGASSYHVQISTAASFGSAVVDDHTVSTRYTPTADLPLGTLYWRVAATSSSNADGPFTDPVQFTKTWNDAPALAQPGDVASLTFPTDPALFSWSPVAGASSYTLEIDDAADFIGATDYQTVNTSYTLTTPQPVGQTYYWRVRANGASGTASMWSDVRSYSYSWDSQPKLHPPVTSPEEGTVTDVELRWDAVPGAAAYHYQISPNGDWANNVTLEGTVYGTSYTLPSTLNNGSYFWRVQAQDSSGDLGTWSDQGEAAVDSFTRAWTKAPMQLAPAFDPNDPGQVPHVQPSLDLSWTPVDHADHYEVQISTDVNFSPANVISCFTNHTEWTPYRTASAGTPPGSCSIDTSASTLLPPGMYYWRVRGIDDPTGVLGAWSTPPAGPWRFVIDTTKPSYVSPANGATVAVPTLSWTAVPHADHYVVTIVSATNVTLVSQKTYATSYTPIASLGAAGPYTWYVQAVTSDGSTSVAPALADRYTFTLGTPTTTSTLTLTAPDDQTSSETTLAMTWTAVTNASKYDVILIANGVTQTLASGLQYPAYTPTALPLTSGTYSWYVVARDSTNHVLATSDQRTFTMHPQDGLTLGTADYLPLGNCGSGNVCADTPTFEWVADPRAADYIVTIANDPTFTNVVRQYITAYPTLTPRDSLPDNQAGGAYYWFVRPCLDVLHTECGPGPDDPSLQQQPPTFAKHSAPVALQSPPDGQSVNGPVTFRWHDYLTTGSNAAPRAQQEAEQYKLQISAVRDFSTVLDTQLVDGTSYTPVHGYANGPLYWRVQAIDGSGQLLTASETREVIQTADAPAIVAPRSGANVGAVPYLQWSPTATGATYAVEVYRNGDLQFSSGNKVLSATTAFSAWSPTTGLPAGVYAWRVRAVDGSGRPGPWSAGATFTLGADIPQLTGPTQHLTSSSDVLFTWQPVPGAASYKWQLAGDIGFLHVVASQTTVMTSWVPRTAFADGTYFWRVVALDGSGNQISASTASPQWQITKDSVAPTVTALTPSTSADLTAGFTASFSEPVTGVSTTSFVVTPSGSTRPVPSTVTVSTDATAARWLPVTPLIAGQTYHVALGDGITDVAGNPLTSYARDVRASTTIENGSAAWTEHWARISTARALGGSYDWSDATGATVSLPFTGPSVSVVGVKAPSGGYAKVSVDGVVRAAKVSFHAAATSYRSTVWSGSGLGAGAHVLTVTVLGSKPVVATGTRVAIDAVKAGAVTTDQAAAGVIESFRRVRAASASGGSYDTATFPASAGGAAPSYAITFRGTRFTIYGLASPASGSAAVTIDGGGRTPISLHSTTTQNHYPVFNSPTLSDRVHTVRIALLGTTSGTRSAVGLDTVVAS